MKIIEQTETRLVFSSGIPYSQNFPCSFDHARGRARITRTVSSVMRKPVELAMADIAGARPDRAIWGVGVYDRRADAELGKGDHSADAVLWQDVAIHATGRAGRRLPRRGSKLCRGVRR